MNAIISKWKSYVGPTDERIESQQNELYKKGFLGLLISGLVVAYYGYEMSSAVRTQILAEDRTNDLAARVSDLMGIAPVLLTVAILIVCLCVVVSAYQKGFMTNNRFDAADEFPWGYYLFISGLAGIATFVLAAGVKIIVACQVFGVAGCNWQLNILNGLFLGLAVFGCCLVAFYFTFKSVKGKRDQAEAKLGD